MSPMPYAPEKRRALTAIFIVFLFIFSEILVAENDHESFLEEQEELGFAIYQYSTNTETYISSANSNVNYIGSNDVIIGEDQLNPGEKRGIYRFINNLTKTADSIISAELTITCDVVSESVPGIRPILYPATIIANFAPLEVTWNEIADSINWQTPGVNGQNDRTVWDVPSTIAPVSGATYQYTLNVTKLTQTSLDLNRNKFDFVLSSLGGELSCYKNGNGNANFDPELTINHFLGVHGDGGSVTVDFLSDGLPLMTNDFIPQADTHPVISYDSLTGTDVEFQFSLSDDFRNTLDSNWLYSTISNPFLQTGSSGEYDIPPTEAFNIGDAINYRYRSIDATAKLSNWVSGTMLLPAFSITNNNDGTATLTLTNDDFNLQGYNLIEDTYVDSSVNTARGNEPTLRIENGPNDQSFVHMGINLPLLGLSENVSIIDANIELNRASASTNGLMLSMHQYTGSEWIEDQATWNYGKLGSPWATGGLTTISTSEVTGIDSNQPSDIFSIDIQNSVQQSFEQNANDKLTYILTGMLPSEQPPTQIEDITFASGEYSSNNLEKPVLNITYSWPVNLTTTEPSLIEPINGQATWNNSNSNLSGNTTPSLRWQSLDNTQQNSIMQVSTDAYFRNVIIEYDSRTGAIAPSSSADFDILGQNSLTTGSVYHWRAKYVDNDHRSSGWNQTSFFVSSVTSQWLGGNLHKLVISSNSEGGLTGIPNFSHATISSSSPNTNTFGYPYISVTDSSSNGKSNGLLSLDINNYVLPSGLAVVGSEITMTSASVSGVAPDIGVWDMNNHDWVAREVTWLESSDNTPWASAGASGAADRANLLDSEIVSTTGQYAWNITSAVQDSMRNSERLDLMFEILPGQSNVDVLFASPISSANSVPTIEITFSPGSNQKPLPPSASNPLNGEWVFVNNSSLETDEQPIFQWTPNNVVPVIGWGFEIDSSDQFDSPDKRTASSWNDPGFDIAGNQYELQSNLDVGKQWFWRVRALSSTYQLGDWSSNFHFYLPDFNFYSSSADTFTTEFSHNSAISNSDVLQFIDTAILDSNVQSPNSIDEPFLQVGTTSSGLNSSMLVKIPIPIDIHPENATVTNASFKLQATPLSNLGVPIAARGILVPWDENATSTQYNSTTNWSQPGGRDIGNDVTAPLDIQNSTVGEMSWDVTPLVQQAFDEGQPTFSLMLYAAPTQPGTLVYFQSSDFTSGQPTLNLTWSYGAKERPTSTSILVSPNPGQIYFNQSSHAIIPDLRPTFDWQWPSTTGSVPDAWIIAFDLDPNDDMAGQLVFDSRDHPSMFDLVNLKFTPDQDISFRNDIYWSVRAVNNSIYGDFSQDSVYFIPNAMGAELSSTDAVLTIQDGTMFASTNFPSVTSDTYLDEGIPTTSQDTNGLVIGNSTILNSNQSSTTAVVSFNLSTISLPAVYEILSANLTLSAISGNGSVDISASRLVTNWDESATWDNNLPNTQWSSLGALRGADSDLPDSYITVNSVGEHVWNITRIVQHSLDSASEEFDILLQPEIFNSAAGTVDGNYIFADSENAVNNIRPKLTIEYRTTEQWFAPAPSLVSPHNNATLWNTSSYELVGPETVIFDFSSPLTNVTDWQICHGQEIRWLDCESSGELNSDFTYDSSSDSFVLDDETLLQNFFGDQWQYWRIRGDQSHRIGHYSPIYQYRMTDSQVFNDGLGNYTVNLSRGSIFELTGDLPQVNDAISDDVNQLVNYGSDLTLGLGYNPLTTGINQAYFSYNISDIYFDTIAIPVTAVFELQVASTTQNINPFDVSVFACDEFIEDTLTYVNTPSCSGIEITKTTISSYSGSTLQWDITTLLQTNFATNNESISFTLIPQTGSNSFVDFYSSDNIAPLRPVLSITYLENIGGLTPPSQPVLNSPLNGDILYDTSSTIVSSPSTVQLTWQQNPDATDYILYINNQNNVISYDSRVDSSIQGNSFTSNQFVPGEVYEWWVQGVNQTIPGPSSQRWSFGIGNPNHLYNDDGTYVYTVLDSSEIQGYSHPDIPDNTITDALPLANFGSSEELMVGSGCYNTFGSTCDTIISLDMTQLPLDTLQSIHSIELTLYVDQWDFSGGAYALDLSIHQFLISNWNEVGITWNTTGSTPGPVAGVDYVSAPLDEAVHFGTDPKITFQVATDALTLADDITLLIRGTPLSNNNNDGFVKLHSSEDQQLNVRPKFEIYHTNISSLNITTSATGFNADDTYTFDVQGIDISGTPLSGGLPSGAQIDWSSTTGTITGTGLTTATLSPTTNGLQTISACYGVICTDYVVDIESGIPVQLFASLDQASDVNSATITADETITVSAYAIDQHSNLVTNEVISFTPSNGSIAANGIFTPYAAGSQTVTVQWTGASSTLQEILNIEVLPGVPVSVVLSGCSEVLTANTSCDLFGSAYDQFSNIVWFDDVTGYTLSATDGETTKIISPTPHNLPPSTDILIGEYTGNFVGQWSIILTTDLGISDSITVDVTHGVLEYFELSSSSPTITADDLLFINATRIDVRGNQLQVNLPIENWTNVADGVMTSGLPAAWSPSSQGTKSISATYQGLTDTVEVFVVRGVIYDLQLIIDDEVSNGGVFTITADESLTASIIALDAKGNQWLVDGDWTYYHPDFANESILSSNYSQEITFTPILSSTTPYAISVDHQEGEIIKSASFVVYVSVGDIENFLVTAVESNGISYDDVDEFDITADDFIEFAISTSDADLNPITNPQVTWLLEDKNTDVVEDITDELLDNAFVWQAVNVGEFEITAYLVNNRGFNLTSDFVINIGHGVPIMLGLQQSVTTQDAGNFVDLQVTGTDADGNTFPQQVVWLENNGPAYNTNATDTEGIYQFNGRSAGNYTLTAEYLTLSSSVNVEVFSLSVVKNIKSNISAIELEQLESITVTIEAYDEYWNRILVPDSARIDTTDRGDVSYLGNGVWELETLDEGEHSATIVIGSITETFTYEVEGNIAGFFAAGGPLYYVGAGLIGIIAVGLLVFLVRLVRSDEDYYEDEDEDYYEDSSSASSVSKDFSQPRISQAPTIATPQPEQSQTESESETETVEQNDEDTSWMADYRVEEDGTEWGQTEDGDWYYREAGADEWIEWTE